jgi:hypothetical protein
MLGYVAWDCLTEKGNEENRNTLGNEENALQIINNAYNRSAA